MDDHENNPADNHADNHADKHADKHVDNHRQTSGDGCPGSIGESVILKLSPSFRSYFAFLAMDDHADANADTCSVLDSIKRRSVLKAFTLKITKRASWIIRTDVVKCK